MSIIPNPDTEPVIGVEKAAAIAGVTRMTAYKFIESGEWPGRQVGKKWAIPTRKFLALYDLLDEIPAGAETAGSDA